MNEIDMSRRIILALIDKVPDWYVMASSSTEAKAELCDHVIGYLTALLDLYKQTLKEREERGMYGDDGSGETKKGSQSYPQLDERAGAL